MEPAKDGHTVPITQVNISRESLAKIESKLRSITDIEILKLGLVLEVHHSALFPDSKK